MLTVFLNSTPDGINKNLGFAQTLTKKSLTKFFLSDRDIDLIFYLLLILLPAKQGHILKEASYKKYPVLIFGTSDCKMVFVLLKEVIILQLRFIVVDVCEPGLYTVKEQQELV